VQVLQKKKRTLSTSVTAYILCGIESVLEEVVVDARNFKSIFAKCVCVREREGERERGRERRERGRVLGTILHKRIMSRRRGGKRKSKETCHR